MARTSSQKIEHMQSVPLFAQLSRRHLQRVARHADEVAAPAGKVLARQDEMGRELLIIVEGQARVERDGHVLARLAAGDFVGEMSLIDHKPRSASVIAETDVVLLTIHSRAFRPLLDSVPGMKDRILVGLVERLRRADENLIG